MKTKYIITFTDPDDVGQDEDEDNEFGGELEHVMTFTNEKKARAALASWKTRTNMGIYLLKIEHVASLQGRLS